MFEYLKECNEFSLFDRANSCLVTIHDSSFILMVRGFFEASLKTIFSYEIDSTENVSAISYYSFSNLLDDPVLIEYVTRKYNYKNIVFLNKNVRKNGNDVAHKATFESYSEEQKKGVFKEVCLMAKNIYEVHTGKKTAELNDETIDEIFALPVDQVEIKRIKEKYATEISNYEKENELYQQAIREKDALIRNLELQVENTAGKMILMQNKLDDLNKQAEDAKFKNVPREEYENLHKLLIEKENEIIQKNSDIQIYKSRIEMAELNNNSKDLEKAKDRNEKLKLALDSALKEKKDIENRLTILADGTYDTTFVGDLLNQIKEINDSYKILVKEKENLEKQIEEFRNNETISNEFARIDKELENSFQIGREYSQLKTVADSYGQKYNELKKEIDDRSPICPVCRQKMSMGYNWFCKVHKDRKVPFRSNEAELRDEKNECGRIMKNAWNIVHAYEAKHPDLFKKKIFKVPDAVIQNANRMNVSFEGSYEYKTVNEPESFLFESITIPKELFKDKYDFKYFSKFKTWYGDNLTVNPPSEEKRNIYTMILRLLNRGIVLKASAIAEDMFQKSFKKDGCCRITDIIDYIKYKNPVMSYNTRESAELINEILPKLYGNSWASYVSTQVPYNAINNKLSEICTVDSTADFIIFGPNADDIPIVVNIDDYYDGKQDAINNNIDAILRNNGLESYRYSTKQLETAKKESPEIIRNHFLIDAHTKSFDISEKYLVACKLQHQLAIVITKALELGYINERANLTIDLSSDCFNQTEAECILDSAVLEVETLVNRFALLYGFDMGCNLLDESKESISIHIGDGVENFADITLRDCFLPNDYMCKLEPFTPGLIPKGDMDESLLTFFLKYIFGFEEFKDGQYQSVRRTLQHKDSIILLATSAGKSMIYQLASYLIPGMIMIISPLRALIRDQIYNLSERYGITNAIGLVSGDSKNSTDEKRRASLHMKNNATSMLYISPERMLMPDFRNDMRQALEVGNVFAVAIDEAHCISEWGHDFRPAYLTIGQNTRGIFFNGNSSPAIIALTGTASPLVLKDIRVTMNIMDEDAIIWDDSFDRSELNFSVYACRSDKKQEYLSFLLRNTIPESFDMTSDELAEKKNEDTASGIIFTPYTNGKSSGLSAESIYAYLQQQLPKYTVDRFYSKNPSTWDKATWDSKIAVTAEDFRNNKINLLVATKAFGMGIDKGNIRYIIHNGMPQSMESYYQEAGRAGRDQKKSECILLFSDDNPDFNIELLKSGLSLEELREKWKSRSDIDDDIHAQLFFHLNQYKGIEGEKETIRKVMYRLDDSMKTNSTECTFKCCSELFNGDESLAFTSDEIYDHGKNISHAIIRLVKLGIVSDYEYSYVNNMFILKPGYISMDQIKKNYISYVEAYDPSDKKPELKKINNIGDTFNDRIAIANRLLEYTYEKIEVSRRTQIANIYELARNAATKPMDEQSEFIKESLNSQFSKGTPEISDIILMLSQSETPNMNLIYALFKIGKPQTKKVFNNKDRELAKSLLGRVRRELESSFGSRPDFILLKDICQMILGSYVADGIALDMVAIESNGKKEYQMATSTINKAHAVMLNLALNTDVQLFDTMVKRISEYRHIEKYKLLKSVSNNVNISDTNRAYVMMSYYYDRVAHML